MGYITNVLKGGVSSAINQVKSYNVGSKISSELSSVGIDLPKLEMPEVAKNMKLNIDPSIVKMPAGMDSYISPLLKKATSDLKLPSEINGVPIPELPDLSSVSGDIDKYMSSVGLDTNKIGIRSVSDILEEPNLSSLKKVQFESLVDMNNLPDLSTVMSDFDLSEAQSQIDQLTSKVPSVDNIDLTKWF